MLGVVRCSRGRWASLSLVPKGSLPRLRLGEGGLARSQSLKELYPLHAISLQWAINSIRDLTKARRRAGADSGTGFRAAPLHLRLSLQAGSARLVKPPVVNSCHRSPGWAPTPEGKAGWPSPVCGHGTFVRPGWALSAPQTGVGPRAFCKNVPTTRSPLSIPPPHTHRPGPLRTGLMPQLSRCHFWHAYKAALLPCQDPGHAGCIASLPRLARSRSGKTWLPVRSHRGPLSAHRYRRKDQPQRATRSSRQMQVRARETNPASS